MRGSCYAGVLWALLAVSYVYAAPQNVPSAASFYIPSIPDIHQDPAHPLKIFAGQLSADPNITRPQNAELSSHLYFAMIKNRRAADRQRLMFWFNGGPGCSSFDGLMMEVGPWRMDGKGGFKTQEGGWEEYMTMVYVDQPAGTGFSVTSTDRFVHTMEEASSQFLEFLRQFYHVFPEYKNVDTYLAGESFAGQWIPVFADAILNSNLGIPLRGAAIGNGWIDPKRQYSTYIDFVVKVGLLEENSNDWKEAKKITDDCIAEINKHNHDEPILIKGCDRLVVNVVKNQKKKIDGKDSCLNIYDVRLHDTWPACGMNWPPDIKPITDYLRRKDVVNALHASAHTEAWTECRTPIHSAFRERTENASVTVMPKVLAKIPILIYAGDQDLICNYVGLEAMIKEMTWNGATGLGTVQTQSWSFNNTPAGTWVTSRNLTYAKIFNASHMAPWDVPHITHDMILRFIGVNFSAILDGTARIPSSIGNIKKPIHIEQVEAKPTIAPLPGKTPEQDKAMWEAYYNAGSSALVLLLMFLAIGTFVWCRIRRRRLRLPVNQTEEESIPLNTSHRFQDGDDEDQGTYKQRKGKERAREPPQPPIFDVGDSDEEDDKLAKKGDIQDV